MRKMEFFLIIGAVIGLLMTLFKVPLDSLIVSVFFVTLGCLYFYFGFALFNGIRFRNIFKSDSYNGIGTWRILTAIGTGLALSVLMIGIMFSVLSYPMAETMLITGIVLTAIIIILAMIKIALEKDKFYWNIILRNLVFMIISVVFLLLPGNIFRVS